MMSNFLGLFLLGSI